MRHLYNILIIALLSLLPLAGQAQNQLFGAYRTLSDVRYVCITRTMLEQMQQKQPLTIGEHSLAPIADQLQNVLIIRSNKAAGISRMEADCQQLQRNKDYEALLYRNLEGVCSLRLFRPEGRYPAEFIIYQNDGKEAIYIILTGSFTANEINAIF